MNIGRSLFKRPGWSLKSSFLAALGLVAVITCMICLTVRKSVWVELEIVALALAPIMFVYMATVLYLGVRFDKKERFSVDWQSWRDRSNVIDNAVDIIPIDFEFSFTALGAEAGILGIIIGFIADVLASVFLMVLISFVLWFGINVLPEAVVIIFFPLFYFYRRSLRYLVAKGRVCKGNLGKSALHAFLSSVMYSMWFYLMVFAGHYISKAVGK